MPEQPRAVAVQARFLLAATAFVNEGDPYTGGVLVTEHPTTMGVLLVSTTGAQIALIYDGHGASDGPPTHWVIPKAQLARELKRIASSRAKYYGDIWAKLSWTKDGLGSLALYEADNGRQVLNGYAKHIKTILQDSTVLIITGETPNALPAIEGSSAVSREFAPNNWLAPYGMCRLGEFTEFLSKEQSAPIGISFLRTKRDNMVQVAFREHEEAVVFLATIRSSGTMRCDNPGWLDPLL